MIKLSQTRPFILAKRALADAERISNIGDTLLNPNEAIESRQVRSIADEQAIENAARLLSNLSIARAIRLLRETVE